MNKDMDLALVLQMASYRGTNWPELAIDASGIVMGAVLLAVGIWQTVLASVAQTFTTSDVKEAEEEK